MERPFFLLTLPVLAAWVTAVFVLSGPADSRRREHGDERECARRRAVIS